MKVHASWRCLLQSGGRRTIDDPNLFQRSIKRGRNGPDTELVISQRDGASG